MNWLVLVVGASLVAVGLAQWWWLWQYTVRFYDWQQRILVRVMRPRSTASEQGKRVAEWTLLTETVPALSAWNSRMVRFIHRWGISGLLVAMGIALLVSAFG